MPAEGGVRVRRITLVPVAPPGERVEVGDGCCLRLGRDPACDVVIQDPTVSRRHLRLTRSGDQLTLDDLGSSGGSFVNGGRVQHAALQPGDVLRLGPRVEYLIDGEAASTTTSLRIAARQQGEGEAAVRHLQVLLEVARALNAATVLEEVLEIVLAAAATLIAADRGYLVLSAADGSPTIVSFPPGQPRAGWAAHSTLLAKAMSERRMVAVYAPNEMSASAAGRGVVAALAAPLVVCRRPLGKPEQASFVASIEVIGGILVERDRVGERFGSRQLQVLESLVADAASTIDSARLYREAREKAKFEHEMTLARTIQTALLRQPPAVPFADIFAFSQPARAVGGDLHMSLVRPDGSVAVAVGDVSGKGVSAALLMAMVQGQLGVLNDLASPLADLLPLLNANLARYNPGNRFLTLAAGVLAPDGNLCLVNGGHVPATVLRAGGVAQQLAANGPMIGLLGGVSWDSDELTLAAGDSLVLCSDGVTESRSDAGEDFGQEGVEDALRAARGADAAGIGRALLDAVAAHRGGREADDDVTVLVARYRGQPSVKS